MTEEECLQTSVYVRKNDDEGKAWIHLFRNTLMDDEEEESEEYCTSGEFLEERGHLFSDSQSRPFPNIWDSSDLDICFSSWLHIQRRTTTDQF